MFLKALFNCLIVVIWCLALFFLLFMKQILFLVFLNTFDLKVQKVLCFVLIVYDNMRCYLKQQ